MIRYDIGDIVRIRYDERGKVLVLMIAGRSTEYIKLPEGKRIGIMGLDNFEYRTKIKTA